MRHIDKHIWWSPLGWHNTCVKYFVSVRNTRRDLHMFTYQKVMGPLYRDQIIKCACGTPTWCGRIALSLIFLLQKLVESILLIPLVSRTCQSMLWLPVSIFCMAVPDDIVWKAPFCWDDVLSTSHAVSRTQSFVEPLGFMQLKYMQAVPVTLFTECSCC